jgi:valyl-tRNA synthetase
MWYEQGRKMSKSLGNVVDPLDTIQEYGTDALRFTLVTGSGPGQVKSYFSLYKIEHPQILL